MIIDAHCHLGQGCRYDVSTQALLDGMDAHGVSRAVIVPVDQYIAVYNRQGNDFILAEATKHPDRFWPMATVNPWFGDEAVTEARRCFEAGSVGLKLHPVLQGFTITDDLVHPLVELAGQYHKPVYFHTGTPVCSMPFQLTELALRFPGVKLIMGHAAFSDFWNDVAAAAQAAANVFLETSSHWPSFIVDMVRQVGSERILFGSDVPKNAMDVEIEKIARHVQDAGDRENIFHRTAEAVFGGAAHAL